MYRHLRKQPNLQPSNNPTGLDRRALRDRRRIYSLDYFLAGGGERRKRADRRKVTVERRENWQRVGKWTSVNVPA